MILVLDASMALSWLLKRKEPNETSLSGQALDLVRASGALVPAIWYLEVANTLLLAERQRVIRADESASFLSSMSIWEIACDQTDLEAIQAQIMYLGRLYKLTAYDASYLELALRTSGALATFDAQLADAVHKAGGRVFGDAGRGTQRQ